MLTKIWTTAIVLSAAASLVAWVCVAAHARGIRPLRAIARFTQKLSLAGVVVFGLMAAPLYRAGSTKVGGGTNNVPPNLNQPLPQMQQRDILSQTGFIGLTGFVGEGNPVNPVQDPITSTNTTRMLTAEDFERGFVMARVGTSEGVDFSAPSNAVVCVDWLEDGAAVDWVYVAMTNWMFKVGTNNVECLRVYSFGKIVPFVPETNGSIATNNWFAPFMASLGVVPEANWELLDETDRPSLVWYCITPDNALVVTWQNVLLDRDTEKPISFQVEFFTDGRFVFRYDLSRLDGETAANFISGTSFDGNEWTTNSLPTNVTSMAFYPLSENDAYNQDSDGDGIATIDELFVHYTDPHNADSDFDGLSDYDELFLYNTNPLNSYSVSDAYCDGFAAKLGDLDPFSFPEGSTNTIYEHIFYTGTTNAPFAYPTSTVETAVLKIMVSGVGSGRLVVGDAVVPLVVPPQMRSGAQTNTLLLAVGKGVRKEVWFDKPDNLDVALASDDFLIGEMPTWYWAHGWLAFPHTDATVPCIHDLYAKARTVTLVHGEEFAGLAANWKSEEQGVAITNVPPVSAEIHGSFPKDQTRTICYTMSHPDYMAGETNYVQTLRFCPQHVSDPAGEPDDSGDDPYYECDCAWSGNCNCCTDEWCHCQCWECPCNLDQSPSLVDDAEAEEAFTNAVIGTLLPDTFYLYRDNVRTKSLPVPGGNPVHCCPCPEHWQTNYVAKVAYSGRVAVKDAAGEDFYISHEPCTVTLSGVSPSRDFGDSTVVFVTNGVEHSRHNYTVLGVKIDRPSWMTPVDRYGQLSASFGFPVEVCSNLYDASELVLRTDVLLDGGYVRIALEEVSGDFEIWLPGWHDNQYTWHGPEKLLDGTNKLERYVSMRKWRNIMRRYGETRRLEIKVLSAAEGSCTLKFEYATSEGSRYVRDFAEQKISSVDPVLLVDYDRDGVVGAADIARHMDGRYAYFWKNDDKWKDDDAFASHIINRVNSSDDVVNGRNDLINFLPISVDVAPIASHWSSSAVYYRLEPYSYSLREAKLAFADIAHTQIGNAPLGNDNDIYGNSLREAPVFELGSGTNLPSAFVSLTHSGRSTLFVEFPELARDSSLCLNVYSKSDNALLFSSSIKLHVGEVSKMIGWENLRSVAGGSDGVPTRLATEDWPDEEHESGNVVFVHGYNMAEDAETPDWAKNVFKKLWWSGLDRGFVAVQWRGNEGQYYQVGYGWVSPNYYGNVQSAFATASALKTAMDDVQSPKWFIAHSLGNMLVSAAIQDYEMPYERYFMLNAAVAMEAYDPTNGITQASHDNMTPQTWTNYLDRVRATHWYELFPEGDGRRLLTWKGRFSNVTNIVNFYSTQEDVVCNGDGTQMPYGRPYSWYNQEYRKGSWGMMLHEHEGGWAFNRYYDTITHPDPDNELIEIVEHKPPVEANVLSDLALQQHPFFLDFANQEMHTSSNGLIVASNYLYRAEMLAYAIPSESYAVGANPLPTLSAEDLNVNMADFSDGQGDLPENGQRIQDKHRNWQHSTFVQRSYKRTHQLFDQLINFIKENSHE